MTDLRPLDELREGFRAAARREIAAERPRRRRWLGPRPLLAAVGALVVAGGVATAADLISVGAPERDGQRDASVRPAAAAPIDVTAPDRPLSWGVRSYDARDGRTCVVVGQVRATTLGIVRDGTFRPYGRDRGGPCVDLRRRSHITDVKQLAGRTVLYGQAGPDVAQVEVTEGSKPPARARTGRRGAYLLVFDGRLDLARLRVRLLDDRGRLVSP